MGGPDAGVKHHDRHKQGLAGEADVVVQHAAGQTPAGGAAEPAERVVQRGMVPEAIKAPSANGLQFPAKWRYTETGKLRTAQRIAAGRYASARGADYG